MKKFIILFLFCKLSLGQDINLNEGLVAHYAFDNESLADYSSNNNSITSKLQPVFFKDRLGNNGGALKFNGIETEYFTGNSSSLNSLNENKAICISAWIYIEEWGDNNLFPIISKSNNFSEEGFFLWIDEKGFNLNDGGGSFSYHFKFTPKKWHHIVVNFAYKPNSSEVEWGFFLNKLGSMSVFETLGETETGDVELYFGKIKRIKADLELVDHAVGAMDDVRIYNRIINEKEIKALYDLKNSPQILPKPIAVSPPETSNTDIPNRVIENVVVKKEVLVPDRSISEIPQSNQVPKVQNKGKYYALIICNNDYDDPKITKLDKPIEDGMKLFETLVNFYSFEKDDVKFLKNATYEQTIEVFDYFTQLVGPSDNFLIFYAGHGYWEENTRLGFWLPIDAKEKNKAQWLANSRLKDYLGAINSKHTLLITDACFSGSIFKTRAAFNDASMAINKLYEIPSRKAMTSGTLKTVPDESMFLKYLVKKLQENEDEYLSSDELFSRFRIAVTNNSPTTPQYGVIQGAGDEGGEFIFIKRKQ